MKLSEIMNKFRILALATAVILVLTVSVSASADVLSLYKNKDTDNSRFYVQGMLPGDVETEDYCVRVSYNGTITVHFKADNIQTNSELYPLTDVLKCKVSIDGDAVYEGWLRDMQDVSHTITGVNRTQNLDYEVIVRLDTSVGNEYQAKTLTADFVWWVELDDDDDGGSGLPGGGGGENPGGGDTPDTPNPPVDPDNPDDPIIDPDDPDAPDLPDDPDNPDTPGTYPDDPDAPDSPHTPGTPGTDPDSPDAPGTVPGDGPASPEDIPGKPSTDEQKKPTGELIKPPNTGDFKHPLIYITGICVATFILFILIFVRKRTKNESNRTIRRLMIALAVVVILAICLCVTTFALLYSMVTVDQNFFSTGTVKINLNDEKPIIEPDEFLFEPGMTVVKDFFIENEGSAAVYYKIYFKNIDGDLADALDVTISDGTEGNAKVLYYGKARNLTLANDKLESDDLDIGERKELYATFHFPPESGNNMQNAFLQFDMYATATQQRNNPGREF